MPRQIMWDCGRREIPYLAQALLELALFTPFVLALMPWARYWPVGVVFGFFLTLILLPFNLIRLMSLLDIPLDKQRMVLAVELFFTLLITLRGTLYAPTSWLDWRWVGELFGHLRASGYPFWARDFSVIGTVIYLWWRGVRLIARSRGVDDFGLQFRIRALLFAPVVVYLSTTRLVWDVTPFLGLYFFCSLVLLALIRAEQVEEESSGLAFPLTPRWVGTIATAAFVAIMVSVLVASSVTSDTLLGPPQLAVRFAATATFYTLAKMLGPTFFYLLNVLSVWLAFILRPLAAALAQIPALPQFNFDNNLSQNSLATPGEATTLSFLPALIAIIFVVGVIGILLLTVSRMRIGREQARGGASSPSLEMPDALESPSLLDKLRQMIPGLRAWRTAASIRRIYRQMVYAATAAGHPRQPTTTPYEFLAELQAVWPMGQEEVALITAAYVRVRYGEVPETTAELDEIFRAWQQLEQKIRTDLDAPH